MVSFTPGKVPTIPIGQRVGWAQEPGLALRRENLLSMTEIEHQFLARSARRTSLC
jgi:hypothetical protein